MGLYLDNGYLNIEHILKYNMPYTFVWGGRGTGKTFGACSYVMQNDIKFLFMRRTQTQADIINKDDFSPFKSPALAMGWSITSKPLTKYNAAILRTVQDGDQEEVYPIGYTCALSTISNLRGFDASDVDILIYDEFIPEQHERPIKEEAAALLNALETIGRNRELQGKPPLRALLLSNANAAANPIFLELGLVRQAVKMQQSGQEVFMDRERGICMINLQKSEISEAKAHTSLYKLTGRKSRFAEMALNNEFTEIDTGHIKPMNLAEYRPMWKCGDITMYKHKSKGKYYCSGHTSGTPAVYGTDVKECTRLRRAYAWMHSAFYDEKITFEDYLCEALFCRIFC